jgi:hypothetical protein
VRILRVTESKGDEVNPRDYESAALPLSYLGPYLPGVFASGAFMAAVKHAAQ